MHFSDLIKYSVLKKNCEQQKNGSNNSHDQNNLLNLRGCRA